MITLSRGNILSQSFRQPPRNELLLVEGLARKLRQGTAYIPDTSFVADAVHGFGILGVFAKGKKEKDKEMALSFFRTALEGETLIDLGAGPQSSVYAMAEFAAICRVKEYVAVDMYARYADALRNALRDYIRREHPESEMGISMIDDDMLRHLAFRADNSANIALNGIDGCVIPRERHSKYIAELVNQIARVVPHFGIAFGTNSPFLGILTNIGFLKITDLPGHGEVHEDPFFKESVLVKP
jgi:hypothetical protein